MLIVRGDRGVNGAQATNKAKIAAEAQAEAAKKAQTAADLDKNGAQKSVDDLRKVVFDLIKRNPSLAAGAAGAVAAGRAAGTGL